MTDDLVKRLNMVDATMHPMTLVIIAREAARRIYHLETEVRVTAGWDRAMQELADKQEQRIEDLQETMRWVLGTIGHDHPAKKVIRAALGEKKGDNA